MHLCVVLLALVGLSVAAPQAAWPYPDSLLPYRYGYPSQGQYKYLPELEDDEEIGPYLSSHKTGRQDLVVGEGQSLRSQIKKDEFWRYGDGAKPVKPTEFPNVSVVETGSVAPVKENEPSQVHAEPPAPPPKVVATVKPAEKPVQPPPFPPARPPPTQPPKEKEEDEEDDDDSEEDDVDEELLPHELEQDDEHEHEHDDSEQDDDADDDEEEDADDDPESGDDDDDDDDRRRQAPLHDEIVSSSVAPVIVPAPVVVSNSSKVVPPVVPSRPSQVDVDNEVVKPVVPPAPVVDTDDESSSEEVGGGVPPVEALVPGYITEQGEVLVPVDTVIGDQPITIVDDPSSPPARGVPFHHSAPYEGFGAPYFYPNLYRPENRQGLY